MYDCLARLGACHNPLHEIRKSESGGDCGRRGPMVCGGMVGHAQHIMRCREVARYHPAHVTGGARYEDSHDKP
jgi:hypothetical protein